MKDIASVSLKQDGISERLCYKCCFLLKFYACGKVFCVYTDNLQSIGIGNTFIKNESTWRVQTSTKTCNCK